MSPFTEAAGRAATHVYPRDNRPPEHFADLHHASALPALVSDLTTTGQGDWPGAPEGRITLTAACLLAPTEADLGRFIDTSDAPARHVASMHRLTAIRLVRLLPQLLAPGDPAEEQIQQLARHVPPPGFQSSIRLSIPRGLITRPASPAVAAAVACLRRSVPVTRTDLARRLELTELMAHHQTLARLVDTHTHLDRFDPLRYTRAVAAQTSLQAAGTATRDFRGLGTDQLGRLLDLAIQAPHPPRLAVT